ncbi:TIR domain-containing protein [Methanosarcina sp. Mfa9]|uniref:TIR domain-containing protein n=1 Tax=Methanosarcina sp. Mfa9 TaxID=3439063 RepID=UPI003F876150
MGKKRVFVSFQYEEDKHYKLLLQAWNANPNFDFGFSDQSVTTPINSERAPTIKTGITKKMNEATYCLVIVGEHTHESEWVNWEIDNAHKLGLKIVAVKIDKSYESPASLYGKNVTWAMSYSQDSIIRALNEASQKNVVKATQTNDLKKETARCKRCNRPLTNPESVRLGLGPSCRKKI